MPHLPLYPSAPLSKHLNQIAPMHDYVRRVNFTNKPRLKNKIFCICTFCAWVFFSTRLPWEFISVKLRLFLISKRGLVVKFACVT